MIKLELTDVGYVPLTVELETWDGVREYLKEYDTAYTRAVVTYNGKTFSAWRFLCSRPWYSTDLEFGVIYPDADHTHSEWILYERLLNGEYIRT